MSKLEYGLKKYLTKEQLDKIKKTKIAILGAGGLGSNAASFLARSGFGNFVFADFDKVEASNLNRQFYFKDQIGEKKVLALKTNLEAINESINVSLVTDKITAANISKYFFDCDIILEAFDLIESKKTVYDFFSNKNIFLIGASGIGGTGNCDEIITHRIKENFYIVGDLKSQVDYNNPPFAPRVIIAAAKQADIILERTIKNGY